MRKQRKKLTTVKSKVEIQKRKFEDILHKNMSNEEKFRRIYNLLVLTRQNSSASSLHAYKNLLSLKSASEIMEARYISNSTDILNISSHDIQEETIEDIINWVSITLNYFKDEINNFIQIKNNFINNILNSSFNDSVILLQEAEGKFGKTLWSISGKMALLFFKKDVAEYNKLSKEIQNLENSYSKSYLGYEIVRCNRTITADRYIFSIGKMTEEVRLDGNLHAVETICHRHIFDPSVVYSSILEIYKTSYDQRIIDQYLSFIRFVLYLKNHDKLPSQCKDVLCNLSNNIKDEELSNLVFNSYTHENKTENKNQIIYDKVIKLYLEESYREVVSLCEKELIRKPSLSVLYIPFAKSLNKINKSCIFNSILGDIINLIISVTKGEDFDNAVPQLKKISQVLNNYNWSFILDCILEGYDGEGSKNIPKKYKYVDLCSLKKNIMSLEKLSNEVLSNPKIPLWRKKKYEADYLFEKGDFESSLKLYLEFELHESSYARSKIIQCYYHLGEIKKSKQILADELIKNSNPKAMPLILMAKSIIKSMRYNADSVELLNSAIILFYYNSVISKEYTQPLSDICENYFNNLGIFSGEEISFKNELIDELLLERILSLDVLDGMSSFFSSEREVIMLRLSLNRHLLSKTSEFNDEKKSFVLQEARSILNKIVINLCSQEAGDGRIYVDKSNLKAKLYEPIKSDLEILKKHKNRDISYEIQQTNEEDDVVFFSSNNEFFNGVMAINYKIMNAYTLDKLYGLDQSLNMGIRHGGIVNLLWAPLKKNSISAKKLSEIKFLPNPIWRTGFGYFKDSILDGIDEVLVKFNEKANLIISKAKNQVHINTGEFGYNSKLFEFSLEPDFQASIANKIDTYSAEALIDDIFLYLDKQANEQIIYAKGNFIDEIEEEMFLEIKQLKEKIESEGLEVVSIQRAVSRSKDDLKESFSQLRKWFDWAKQTETNFDLNAALEKASSAVKQYYPWLKLNLIGANTSRSDYLGQHFTDTVMILTLIIENAVKHSNPRDEYTINYSIVENEKSLLIVFNNTLDFELNQDEQDNIKEININLENNIIENSAKDTGSGLYKVKKIINHHLKINNKMNVTYLNKVFSVSIEFHDISTIKAVK